MSPLLLSCDMDGTIVFNGRIAQRDLEAMARWRAAGNLLVFNTGRSRRALGQVVESVGVAFDYAVLYTGAVITDAHNQAMEVDPMPAGVLSDLLSRMEGKDGVTVFATTLDGDLLLYDTIGTPSALLNLFTPGGIDQLQGRELIGVPMRFAQEELAVSTQEYIAQRWEGQAVGFRNQDFLDVVPAGASKGVGLKRLLAHLQGESGPYAGQHIETISVGDSWNDISMHRVSDHAFALPWSPDDVVAKCTGTVGSLSEVVDRFL